MQPFTSDSVSTAPSPSIRPPSEKEAGKGIIMHYNHAINCVLLFQELVLSVRLIQQ